MVWRGLFRVWNKRFLQQQVSHCETSQCRRWQQEHNNIGADGRGLLQIRNQRFLQQPFSYVETSPCCPWQPQPRILCTYVERSASNLKPTVSATTIFRLWNVSVLSKTVKASEHRYWFEEVCFESETNGFCNNTFLMVKRLNVVHDSQSLGSSIAIWKRMLRIWNQRCLRQRFSYGETSQCCPWQPTPWMICTELKKSASNQKPMVYAATISYCESSQCCPWQPKPMIIYTDLRRSTSNLKLTVCAVTIFWFWNVSMLFMATKAYDDRYWFKGLLWIWNQRFLQQPFSYGATSQCCARKTKAYDNRYWFEEVCFESETNNFCSNHFLMVKRLKVVNDSQNLGSSVMIWRSLLRIWNSRFLQQPSSYCEKS